MFKTLLKIPGMLFLLTLHENDNQRAFVVYSLFCLQFSHMEIKYLLVQ